MLKRKLVQAGVFSNGLMLFIATVNGTNHQPATIPLQETVAVDPVIRQLQEFDPSFVELNGMPATALIDVPKIHLNSHAVKFVKDYTTANADDLERIGERGKRYFPLMDSVFSHYHLPIELKYLAVIESELKATAVSRVGAAGPWQLMTTTARDLSLRINSHYDERVNYTKSTVAAAKYLRDLYDQFGDWLLVIAAYNSGPVKVMSAIKKSGSHNFWVLQNYLPAETRGHVKRFIATHYYFEGSGSVTTLTKVEALNYKNAVSRFIEGQKTAYTKEAMAKAGATKDIVTSR